MSTAQKHTGRREEMEEVTFSYSLNDCMNSVTKRIPFAVLFLECTVKKEGSS